MKRASSKLLLAALASMIVSIIIVLLFPRSIAFIFTGANRMESYTMYYYSEYIRPSRGTKIQIDTCVSIYNVANKNKNISDREWLTMQLDTLLKYKPRVVLFDIVLSDDHENPYNDSIQVRLKQLNESCERLAVAAIYDPEGDSLIHSFFTKPLELEYGHTLPDKYEDPIQVKKTINHKKDSLYWLPFMIDSCYTNYKVPCNRRLNYSRREFHLLDAYLDPRDSENYEVEKNDTIREHESLSNKIVIVGLNDYNDRHPYEFLRFAPWYKSDVHANYGTYFLAIAVANKVANNWITLVGWLGSIFFDFFLLLLFVISHSLLVAALDNVRNSKSASVLKIIMTIFLIFVFELYLIPLVGSLPMTWCYSFDLCYVLLAIVLFPSVQSVIDVLLKK